MNPTDGTPLIQSLTRAECLDLLAQVKVGRIAMTVGALPAVRPVRFVLTPPHVVFRAAPESRLRSAANTVVAFQADHLDENSGTGWTVQVQGRCEEFKSPDIIEELRNLPLPPWHSLLNDTFLGVETTNVTGEEIRW